MTEGQPSGRWGWAQIDPAAIAHNTTVLRRTVAPADVWAVVKADGYGHGAAITAKAALGAGAAGLCVALVDEGVALREHGIDAPILLFGHQPPEQLSLLLDHDLTPTVYSVEYLDRLVVAANGRPLSVHINIDSGMQRVGVKPHELNPLLEALGQHGEAVRVEAVYTHLACADEPEHPANATQLSVFDAAVAAVRTAGFDVPVIHAANSAGGLAHPSSRCDLVRAGIALYGISPGPDVDHLSRELRPAMSVRSRVAHVQRVAAGSSTSYGWRHRFAVPTTVATVPMGYADGVPRRLGTLPDRVGADVLIGGRRRPIVGVVTMDQFMVDCGDDAVAVGDEVVLIGTQSDETIRAEDWAERLGTIGYEIVCGIGARVPRRVDPDTAPLAPGVDPGVQAS